MNKVQLALEYFYCAGQRIILSVFTFVWTISCLIIGIPASLLLEIVAFSRTKIVYFAAKLASIKGRIGRSKQRGEAAVDAMEHAEEEEADETPVLVTTPFASLA